MNLDTDRVIRIFFSLKYEFLYRLGLDGISACFCSSSLNQSPCVPYQYINKLQISSLKGVLAIRRIFSLVDMITKP